jgi:hypothetical protein
MKSVRWLCLCAGFIVALAGGVAAETPAPAPTKPAAKAPADAPVAAPWPRKFTEDGTDITLHQPQVEDWQGNTITGRLAVAVKTGTKPDAEGKPQDTLSYGAAWFNARADVDKVERKVTLTDVRISKVSFPTDRANEAKYQTLLGKIAAQRAARVVSLDQLESALAINRELKASRSVSNVRNDPPDILFSFQPALLVLIDGEPHLKAAGSSGVERVVNTRSLLVKTGGRFYLSFAGRWMTSLALAGPWTASLQVPAALEQVRAAAEKSKVVDLMDKPADAMKDLLASGKLPQIFVSTKPAELNTFDGDPAFVDIPDTSLAYASNTPSDVFVDKSHDNFWYVLISGRWFAAPGTNGPWTYTAGNVLPGDFSKIPPDSEKSAVLASIPGTPEARESLIANSIPQTATVKKTQASLTVQYDGIPDFKPIEGTSLTYAWNTSTPVIKIESAFYAVQNGVWFSGASPNGPWTVATDVPAAIYSIPASSPLQYVTYVRVYGGSGDEIYVGYTPGYYGTVVSNDVVVYGTGYTCDPWVGDYWYGCPATYGFNVDFGYDPWVGWTFGYGWGWGYPYAWYGPWWGPWGWYPYYPYYGWGYWGGGIATANIYGRWGNSVVAGVGAAWANPWTGNYGSAVRGRYQNERTGGRGAGYAGRNYNAYTGTTTGAAGGIRYNPQTGRVVGGNVAGASNPYTGNAVAGGSRTTVNTNTGRVTESAGVAGRTNEGAGAAGAFNSEGARGDVSGAGYVHYDKGTGEVSKGGVVNYNDQIYAGKDGNVYKYDKGEGWSEVGGGSEPKFNRASDLPSAGNLDNDRYARDRGGERDYTRNPGTHGGGGRDFDRGSYGGNYRGQMGGYRSARGGGGFGGGGRRR